MLKILECRDGVPQILRDVFLHTATGTVDVVTATDDGEITESVQLCDSLGDDVLLTLKRNGQASAETLRVPREPVRR